MKQDDVEAAVAALNHALRADADLVYDDLAHAVRHIVRLRDGLIAERRHSDARGDRLACVNSILTQIVGAEYPLDGIRRERIEKIREQLTSLLE